jgi:hypothetical protein
MCFGLVATVAKDAQIDRALKQVLGLRLVFVLLLPRTFSIDSAVWAMPKISKKRFLLSLYMM